MNTVGIAELVSSDDTPALGLWIGGKQVTASDGETIESIAPATNEVIANIDLAGAKDIDRAVQAAADAAERWRRVPVLERANLLEELAAKIESQLDAFGTIDAKDTGIPYRTMRASAAKGAFYLRSVAGVALEMTGKTIPATGNGLHYTLHQPWGVVGGISAYNHPILFACQKLGPALVAGNSVVLKPAEQAPVSSWGLAQLASEVLPPGVLNVVPGAAAAGAALAAHPNVQRISFTGGASTGLKVQTAAASSGTFKVLTLELGGKNPIIVFPDAPMDEVVAAIVRGTNFIRNVGQSCGSTTRLLISEERQDEIVAKIVNEVADIKLGLPEAPDTMMGSLISKLQQRRVLGFISEGVEAGATLLTGGSAPANEPLSNGAYVLPTVFNDVTTGMSIAQEEIFGPVLSILPWKNESEALRIANDSRYGLTASVWTNDIDRALRFARELEVGYVWINDVESRYLGVPVGGWKESGIGRRQTLADELLSFTRGKSVNVAIRPES